MENKFQFSAEALTLANKIIKRYPEGKSKSALLPLLHIAQGENQGWLSVAAMDYVADFLKIQPIEVYEVASFYTMYNLKPVGKYVLEVCRTGPCCLNGAEDVIDYLQNKLGIKVGETTPDGKFTIKTVECLASCGSAPMMQVGMYYHENLNKEKIDGLLEEFGK
jgi:NADH-quinone oxidoreductase subunit E